jgi:hypothetical protein
VCAAHYADIAARDHTIREWHHAELTSTQAFSRLAFIACTARQAQAKAHRTPESKVLRRAYWLRLVAPVRRKCGAARPEQRAQRRPRGAGSPCFERDYGDVWTSASMRTAATKPTGRSLRLPPRGARSTGTNYGTDSGLG